MDFRLLNRTKHPGEIESKEEYIRPPRPLGMDEVKPQEKAHGLRAPHNINIHHHLCNDAAG